jgi:hypothetical protein
MSPGNRGVFQLLKEVTFRSILAFYNSGRVTCSDKCNYKFLLRFYSTTAFPTCGSLSVPSPGLTSQVSGIA